jgi:hypothetical protein
MPLKCRYFGLFMKDIPLEWLTHYWDNTKQRYLTQQVSAIEFAVMYYIDHLT